MKDGAKSEFPRPPRNATLCRASIKTKTKTEVNSNILTLWIDFKQATYMTFTYNFN